MRDITRCCVCNRPIEQEKSCRHPKCGEEKKKKKDKPNEWAIRLRAGMKILRGDTVSRRRGNGR